MQHNPLKFAVGLSAKLATRSRHVCAFLGAGVSKACGLPDVSELQTRVLNKLSADEKPLFEKQLIGRNLEQALSRIRKIAALLEGDSEVDGLTAGRATLLDQNVCQAIAQELRIENADLKPMRNFAAWAARTNYHSPLELFTVNYDLLLESALEEWQVPYFDGFIGTLDARFRTELIEPMPGMDTIPSFFVRLWKLHGSLNWEWLKDQKIARRGYAVPESAAIYPSDMKYDESRRLPFIALQDRFRRALDHPETVLIVAGYSFGDDHLNEIIFDAASRRQRSEITVFCYAGIPENLADRASTTPNLQVISPVDAIIGGIRGTWHETTDLPDTLWSDGKLALHDFKNLASFLAKGAEIEDPYLPRATDAPLIARLI
jgi:hypothetical protein